MPRNAASITNRRSDAAAAPRSRQPESSRSGRFFARAREHFGHSVQRGTIRMDLPSGAEGDDRAAFCDKLGPEVERGVILRAPLPLVRAGE